MLTTPKQPKPHKTSSKEMVFSGNFDVSGKLVVITGGSQGLGAELAKQVFSRGASVIVVARTESNLVKTVEQIEHFRTNDKQTVGYVAADISQYEECERALDGLTPDIVLLCAGSSLPKLFLDLSPKELKQGVDINYNTALNFTHVALRKMASLPKLPDYKRHFVFCSSVLAVFPFIGYGQYAPSKAAIRSLADIVRQESLPYNIKVHTVYPGNFASEGFIEEQKTKPEITKTIEGASVPISTERATSIILWFLDHGYESIYTDAIGWLLSAGMLGMSPRALGLVQVPLALLLAIIAPIFMIITDSDIKKYFKKNGTKRE